MSSSSLRRNPLLLCAFRGLNMALFPMAIITLLWKHEFGLSMTEIMVLQAIFGLVVAVMEFPSGYVADRIGYRPTLVAGSLLAFVGWAIYAVAFDFWTTALAEIILGVALALVSGADTALLYESLQETDQESAFATWFGRFRFSGEIAEGSAALAAGFLFAYWQRLPFLLQLLVWTINIGIAVSLVEPQRRRPPSSGNWRQIQSLVRFALVHNRQLRAIIFITVAFGLSSFIPVWLIQLYATGAGVPVIWLGPLWAAANYSVALASLSSASFGQRLGFMPALLVCILLVATGYIGLGLSYSVFGFVFYVCITLMRGLNGPILHHEEQRLIPSSDRAGLISFRSLVFRANFVWIGPCIGYAVDSLGQHQVLFGAGCILTLICLGGWCLLLFARRSAVNSTAG